MIFGEYRRLKRSIDRKNKFDRFDFLFFLSFLFFARLRFRANKFFKMIVPPRSFGISVTIRAFAKTQTPWGSSSKVERSIAHARTSQFIFIHSGQREETTEWNEVSSFVGRRASRNEQNHVHALLVFFLIFVSFWFCLFSDGSREKPGDHGSTENRRKRPCLRYPKKVFPLERSIVKGADWKRKTRERERARSKREEEIHIYTVANKSDNERKDQRERERKDRGRKRKERPISRSRIIIIKKK